LVSFAFLFASSHQVIEETETGKAIRAGGTRIGTPGGVTDRGRGRGLDDTKTIIVVEEDEGAVTIEVGRIGIEIEVMGIVMTDDPMTMIGGERDIG
jgi:hypothetical protein